MLQQRSVALMFTTALAVVGAACTGEYLTNALPEVESENPALEAALSSSGQTAKLFIADAFGTVLLRYEVTDGGGAVADGSVNTVSSVRGIAFSPNGEMFTSVTGGTIRRFLDPEGAATANGVIDVGNTGAPFGSVQWSDFRASELFQAQESGTVLRFTFDASGNPSFNGTVTAGGATRGLRVNPITTELFVSNLSNTVHRFLFDAAGNATSNGAVVGGLNHSHGMVFTPWGELLVANFNANNVARFTFDASGNAVANGVISGGDMAGPLDLDMSPWGELFVTNHNQNPGKVTRWVFTSQDASATAVYNGSFTVPTNMGVMRFAGAATGGGSPTVFDGNLVLSTQAEVDAFAYTEVTGFLTIDGSDISDLTPLATLTASGGLEIRATSATSLAGLENLASLGSLAIQNNPVLASLAALSNIGPTLMVQPGAPALYVASNDALTSLAGLEGLTTIDGNVFVFENQSLVDLSGLANVTEMTGYVDVSNNTSMVALGLASLSTVGRDFTIANNPALTGLGGLSSLTSVGRRLFIQSNGSLTDLQGLENLQSADGVVVTGNASLAGLGGLSGLSSLDDEGLIIRSNPVLADVDGLTSLTSVAGVVWIDDNPSLSNLDGLSALTAVIAGSTDPGDLIVTNNSTLANCQGIASLISNGGVAGATFLQDNAPGCNSIAEITADYTPTGTDVPVNPIDQTTGQLGPVSLTFDNVTSAGETTVSSSQVGGGGGPPPPANFRLGQPPTKFDVQTTATFTGSVEVCIDYSTVSYGNENNLKILTFDEGSGAWEDVTTSLDTTNDIICGEVTSFSPFLVAEENVAPVVTSVGLPADPIAVGTSTQITADFLDDNPGDVHTATIDWGDGAITAGTVTEPSGGTAGTVSGSHTYSEAGVYTVTVTVTEDVDPASDLSGSRSSTEETTVTFVVVYDPDGGFVTGGGWIDSPAGAYVDDPTLAGKANFGFVSKYKKGASTPTGNTEFHFKTGDLNFHSSAYNWLVVNQGGSNAQFRGSGTINGSVAPNGSDYKFMIWAGDDDPDTFRIKIWYEDSAEVVVYDNGFNQTIGGGSIKVHKN